ncbi:hypothetical protein TNCV_194351, partial [Trichonephila clavipes]
RLTSLHWREAFSKSPYLTLEGALDVVWPAFEMKKAFPYWWTWKETVGGANCWISAVSRKNNVKFVQADEKLVCYWSSGVGERELYSRCAWCRVCN